MPLAARKLGALTINVHPDVADYMLTEERDYLDQLQSRIGQPFTVRSMDAFHHEQFEIYEF
jgi:Ribonuclease G/E